MARERRIGSVGTASRAFVGVGLLYLGAELFYGLTLLIAALRGQPSCEATLLSNIIPRRDDQIGCSAFSPIDV
jgi:hypothetical protein